MAREHAHRLQAQVIGQTQADRIEQFLKYPAHREHGRAGVHRRTAERDLAHLAAGLRCLLEHQHFDALRRQLERAHQPADAGPDDDDALVAHRLGPANVPSVSS